MKIKILFDARIMKYKKRNVISCYSMYAHLWQIGKWKLKFTVCIMLGPVLSLSNSVFFIIWYS